MGNWNITIQGIGQHHNNNHKVPSVHLKDANYLLEKFVKELKENGHRVESANFTYGGSEKIEV